MPENQTGPSRKLLSGSSLRPGKKFLFFLPVALLLAAVFYFVDFDFTGQFEGIFVLKGHRGKLVEIKDDLYLGDGRRLLFALDFEDPKFLIPRLFTHHDPDKAYLDYDWDNKDGSGFIRNMLPGGKQLLTCFGRYKDESDRYSRGLFVGGGLPKNVENEHSSLINETGMAYYDGKRWYHIWCNVNEGIISSKTGEMAYPGDWEYEGSRILNQSSQSLAITTSHKVVLDGIPLHIDRYAYFKAGETYFILNIVIKNIGYKPVTYNYVYGDEPWLGNFGSSKGNIGWIKDRTILYTQMVDPTNYDYAGFYDYGNSIINEGHEYTKVANFLQTLENRPKYIYFANKPIIYELAGEIDQAEMFVPLESNTRFIGFEWAAKTLAAGESDHFSIAVGMAGHDPNSDFPVKPDVKYIKQQAAIPASPVPCLTVRNSVLSRG